MGEVVRLSIFILMQKTFYVAAMLLLSASATAQEPDSMRYYVRQFADSTLSADDRRIAGQKIWALQKTRHLKSEKEAAGDGDSLILDIEQRVAARLATAEATTDQICSILQDPTSHNSVKLRALAALSALNTYRADSVLVSKIDKFNYLGEPPGSAGGEIDWMYPCFGILVKKSGRNYSLLMPIISNLKTSKTEDETLLLRALLENIFPVERLLGTWLDAWIAGADDPVMVANLEAIKNVEK